MNFDLDEQQLMLRDLVARFVADRYDLDRYAEYRKTPLGFSPANWALLAETGLLALPFGEEHGGIGAGPVELITVAEQLGRGLCAEPWLSDLIMAGRLLERAGSAAQREAWIGRIIAGEARLALAYAELSARYNPAHVACKVHDGALSGTKTFVLAGEGVQAYVVSAREQGDAADAQGLSLWLVPADAPGLLRRNYRLTDGSVACELRLDRVGGERLPGDAAAALEATFNEARVAACAELVGIMDVLLQETLEYARTRRQFGQAIGSFQAIQHRLADLYVLLEQSRSHLLRATLSTDAGHLPAAIAGAKSFISESAIRLGEECIQFHGGMGVTDELPVGHRHKRILLLANLFGDPETELARYVSLAA